MKTPPLIVLALAQPEWFDDVPFCSESCESHDGKRCELTGNRPSSICEPTVKEMAELIKAST